MTKFVIEPHFRLQEWVAEEKGYFHEAGLDYEFKELIQSTDGAHHETVGKSGAFQSIEKGRASNVTCACHWTVNVAASRGLTKLYADVYSVTPSAIFVPAGSPIKTPADLAGVPISVGYQSGSHYATVQALEQYMPANEIKLTFDEGLVFHRMDAFLQGKLQASTLFSGPYYLAEQLGFRKILDNTFMVATMLNGDPDPEDVRKYFQALKRAQSAIDLRPDRYTHFYKKEFPTRFHDIMDTGRWGPGERIVFESYSEELYDESFSWIAAHEIFANGDMGPGDFARSVVRLGQA